MEHAEATETMAAERYLLSEMSPEDRDAFEEHFFGCSECAAAVRDGAAISAAIRAGGKAAIYQQPRRPWLAAAAVILLLAAVSLVQELRQRRALEAMRAPRLVGSVSFLTAGSRGNGELTIHDASAPFIIDFDVPPHPQARRYVVRVVDADGKAQTTLFVSTEAARDTQHILFPAGALKPGRYSLEVHAEPAGSPATAWPFVVR